jgi:hypothetical protein
MAAAASFPSTGSGSVAARASAPLFRQLREMGFFSLKFNPKTTNQLKSNRASKKSSNANCRRGTKL